MKHHEIAAVFERIADVLELKGEDRFRINSYRKAARSLGDLTGDVEALAAAGKLETIPGIGKSTAAKIAEYLRTGRMALLDEVMTGLPAGVLDLLKISGLGPKTVAALHKDLGVGSLDDLQAALDSGRILMLPGMGEKKAANVRRGLEELRQMQAAGAGTRVLLGLALPTAEGIAARLAGLPGVSRAVPAGSVRRRRETIGDIDVLVTAADGKAVLDAFVKFPEAAHVLGHGDTKASIRTGDGQQVDVRVVDDAVFGAALMYFTGSKDHNVRLRELAIKQGLKLSEYGLFQGDTVVAGRTEEEVYARLGLRYIPPELREDRGEIAAAAAGGPGLPELVELSDIRGDLHMHTTASDGRDAIEDMARAAMALGYEYIAVTDHSQSLGVARGLSPDRLRQHIRDIRAAEQKLGFRILAGTESDIREDGSLDYDDDLLAELDIVIGSIHGHMRMTPQDMTKRLIRAVSNPHLDVLGHPTARYINKRPPVDADWPAVIAACGKAGAAMEVNASMERLDLSDVMCRAAVDAGVPILIDTDSHATEGLGQMVLGVATARRGWAPKSAVLNTRPRKAFEAWLKARG